MSKNPNLVHLHWPVEGVFQISRRFKYSVAILSIDVEEDDVEVDVFMSDLYFQQSLFH